ncbi:IS3 family transposase [Mycolicibacterium goodii]|uniref:IS3 family transposase n=1 Tax=Mycolicibacterium goodii TaxID=134601 RepID=A0ABS6HYW8_MYCGD|nr:IS3 family transposase [Mycolicibacterium goodii]MBU8826538.1 IS3 family transposase [Mycolicibacterium goodii]MBU8841699.1 IS3 family transposase [Mycolicibacterium goodii]
MARRYDEKFKGRAVRLVADHRDEYDSEFACIQAVAQRLSIATETLRRWMRQNQIDSGERDGVSTDMAWENRELKRKNRELEETIEILKAATKFLRAGERPATPLICGFIAEHRARFGVAPICRVLTEHGCAIAPRTFYAWLSRPPSARTLWDTVITEVLAGYYEPDEHGRRPPESLYGATKMWAHLQRQGIAVARCTVERLMRANGWQGVTRAKKVRTTIADPAAARAADLVKRQFRVPAPNVLLVADFTYVRLASGVFVYTAFAIDAYAGRIVGWTCSASKEDRFVRQAIRHAAQLRLNEGNPLLGNTIHHSDAGSQYTSVRFGETLALSGLVASIGTVGDAFDNALAETTIGLYKTEAVRKDSPLRRGPLHRLTDVEMLTAAWVHWYNTDRLMHRLGRIPPTEYEAIYYATNTAPSEAAHP